MSKENDLMTLKTKVSEASEVGPVADDQNPTASSSTTQPPREGGAPLMGLFAVGFALLSIFAFAPIFAPLALIFSIIALFMGQVLLGVLGIGLAVIGIVTSPIFMTLFGIGAFLAWLGL